MKITREHLKAIVKETMIEESEYQEFFKKALEKAGKSIPSMSDEEKKEFFNKKEKTWKGRGAKKEQVEELTAAQKKLPPALQKAIEKKDGKKEEVEESINEDIFDDNGMRKAFPWANKKELNSIYRIVFSGGSGGVDGVIKKYSKDRTFKPFLKKVVKLNLGESINEEIISEGKFRKEERTVKNLASVLKIDFSEAIESLEEDGVLEAMDHLENAIERIKDVHKILKRKS